MTTLAGPEVTGSQRGPMSIEAHLQEAHKRLLRASGGLLAAVVLGYVLVLSGLRLFRPGPDPAGEEVLTRVHRIAPTQARCHPGARELLTRRKAGGDGGMEARRILKRRLSDVVYRALTDHQKTSGARMLTLAA